MVSFGMRLRPFRLALLAAVAASAVLARADSRAVPPTRVEEVRETLHGVEVVDPYRWLEDQNSPQTRAWIDAQNAYSHGLLDALPGRDSLKKRLEELLHVDAVGVPVEKGGRYFFTKRDRGQDLFVICVRKTVMGKDEILVDPHPMSPDKTTSVTLLDVSNDGRLIAYGVRQGGEDEVVLRLREVDTGKDLPDTMPKARYQGVSINLEKTGVYYARHDQAAGPRVLYHALGTDPGTDKLLFGEGLGPEKIVLAGLSEDGRYLYLTVFHGSAPRKTEVYFRETASTGPFTPVVNDVEAKFLPDVAGDKMYLQTDWQAPNGRILEVDLKQPARDRWREVVAESDATLEGFSLAGGRIFVNALENVASRVRIYGLDGKRLGEIAFPSLGTVGAVAGRWASDEAFFSFKSFHIPETVYRYGVKDGAQSVWARQDVPIDSDAFEVHQEWYASKDGTRVPMFLVHRKGLKLDGTNPTLLGGYGGFNLSMTPSFSPKNALWVERGGVFALPSLRGGGEFGERWHQSGMLERKQNVFDDFAAAAEWLIKSGYTSPARLAISGGSNGGLLVGAALTQRPELFGAVVCSYPLLDMVRYQKFLVAGFWVPEYGSSDDKSQFETLRAYSPYHNVKAGIRYPSVLFVTGDSDTRVAPLHARKMAALMQAKSAGGPALLLYDTKSGHSAGKPVSQDVEDLTDQLCFLFWRLGVQGPAATKG
jgi:prolyl oligopeptidase